MKKQGRECGDYGFDPLQLMPTDKHDKRWIQEVELNHGRLAMIAMFMIFFREYFIGLPIWNFDLSLPPNDLQGIFFDQTGNQNIKDVIDSKIRRSML